MEKSGYYTYILYSKKLQKFYTGSTENLENRLASHNAGLSTFTSSGIPWIMVWNLSHTSRKSAVGLEKHIKKRGAKRF